MEKLLETITEMTFGEITGKAALIIAALSVFFEFTPVKLTPLTTALRWIGEKMNGDVIKKVDSLEQKVDALKKKQEEERAEDRRVRILRFGDELLHDKRHSKESFDQTLKDISDYEDYCRAHPEFKNDMTVSTTEVIKEQYKKCFKEHSFL